MDEVVLSILVVIIGLIGLALGCISWVLYRLSRRIEEIDQDQARIDSDVSELWYQTFPLEKSAEIVPFNATDSRYHKPC